ncbi:alkene reductase [Pseudochryseolinea flava]|uniref:Alkene reductase n=1 Tax=Pseudochryseolinea flava TaxID=2059302 RepID=A0A364Y462_9BACT|nr:alkene reductase [Pseudochryseolinea flava]RAW01740.1 alkene reductase [Pseudochryseolinea flava]
MTAKALFSSLHTGSHIFSNRIVMAPLTRSRAIENKPNLLMASYYAQRAEAGLIISEGTSPSPNGLGYPRMPGIFTQAQIDGWKLVTQAVHAKGGKIFVQLMHSGRIGHQLNLPKGAHLVAPSVVQAKGFLSTDQEGKKAYGVPRELTIEGIQNTKEEYVQAAKNAIAAGFDGVELHGANGYLLEQFLSPHTNQRSDDYGGSVENRIRFVLEVASVVADAIGKEKTGIRLSPYGVASDMHAYDEIDETYTKLAAALNEVGLLYIHIADHSASGAPAVPSQVKAAIRREFSNVIIQAGGYDVHRAEADVTSGHADLVAFGKTFINNPDLVDRLRNGKPLNLILDASTFYTSGAKGYTDYPVFEEAAVTI